MEELKLRLDWWVYLAGVASGTNERWEPSQEGDWP